MDYPTGSDVWVSMNPTGYQVIHSEPNKLVLRHNEQAHQEIELIKRNGKWTNPNIPSSSFQVELLFPSDPYLTAKFMDQLDLHDLSNFCQTNPKINEICQSDNYWKNRLLSKFGDKLEGLFLSGKGNLPILKGQHSISEYIYVERELTRAMSDVALLGHEEYLQYILDEDTGDGDFDVNVIMYILRHFRTENPSILDMIINNVIYGPYPQEFILEYLENGNEYDSYDDEAWNGLILSSGDSEYDDLWTRIFELGTYPDWVPDEIVGHDELEDNEYLQNLAREYL